MPETLQQLVDRIPVAERGAPITVDLHNTLREALMLLASTGVGVPTTGPKTLTVAPAFLEFGGGPNWVNLNGFASPPGEVAEGWTALHLPDGVRIDGMIVKGRSVRNAESSFQFQLRYASLDPDKPSRPLVTINVPSGTQNPFELTGQVSIPGVAGAELTDARKVQNDTRVYFVTASVDGVGDNDQVEIHSIHINYTVGAS